MQHTDIKRLSKAILSSLPKNLYWLPSNALNDLLGVSNSTRRDYTKYLGQLGFIEAKPKRSGYSYQEILIMMGFRKLAEKLGSGRRANPEQATYLLPTLIEEINHGLSGQN